MGRVAKGKKLRVDELARKMEAGKVYRRDDILRWGWSNSVDRHLAELVKCGILVKKAPGVYHCVEILKGKVIPKPDEHELLAAYLRDDRFLLIDREMYKKAGLLHLQIHAMPTVYNHTKHCEFRVGGRKYKFWLKHHFPEKATPEFLLVDAINNLVMVGNKRQVKEQVMRAAFSIKPLSKLKDAVKLYGGPTARNFFAPFLGQKKVQ